MSIGGDFRDYSDDDREEAYAMSHGVCAGCDGDGCMVPAHLSCQDGCGTDRLVESTTADGIYVHRRCLVKHDCIPCPECGPNSKIEVQDDGFGPVLFCGNCYDADCVGDPPEFRSKNLMVHGNTMAEAIAEWNIFVDDITEVSQTRG